MALNIFGTLDVIETLENFISRKRPPENVRHKVDLSYRIEGQSVIIYTIRPRFDNPEIKIESEIAKTTFLKEKNLWKVFWMRSNLKWHLYEPCPTTKSIDDFVKLVEEDKNHCFWG